MRPNPTRRFPRFPIDMDQLQDVLSALGAATYFAGFLAGIEHAIAKLLY